MDMCLELAQMTPWHTSSVAAFGMTCVYFVPFLRIFFILLHPFSFPLPDFLAEASWFHASVMLLDKLVNLFPPFAAPLAAFE